MKRKVFTTMVLCVSIATTLSAQTEEQVKQLQEVSITSTWAQRNTPMSVTEVNSTQLRQNNFGQNLPSLLLLTPSLFTTSDDGSGVGYAYLRIRGTELSRINVSTNGIPLNDSESHGAYFVNLPDLVSSLSGVQIQRGVGASTNGAAAFGATINMRTDNLSISPGAEVSLSGGAFGTFRRNVSASTGLIADHFAFDARLSRLSSDGYLDRSSANGKSYFFQGSYYSANTLIKFLSFGGSQKTGISWGGVTPEDAQKHGYTYNPEGKIYTDSLGKTHYYDNNTDNYNQTHYQLHLSHQYSTALSLSLALHYTRGFGFTDEYKKGEKPSKYNLPKIKDAHGEEIRRGALRKKYLDNHFYGLTSSLIYRWSRHNLTVGVAANRYQGGHYGQIAWAAPIEGIVNDPSAHYYSNDGKKVEASAFAKLSLGLTEKLSAFADLQYRFIDYRINGTIETFYKAKGGLYPMDLKKTFHFIDPKVGVNYQFNPEHRAYASVAVGHRDPERDMYTQASEQQYAKPEMLLDYELGYGYTTPRVAVEANIYYMDYRDQFVSVGERSDLDKTLRVNVPKSYRLGVEIKGGIQIMPWLQLNTALALSRNKIDTYKIYQTEYKNTNISYSPSLVATNMLTFSKGGFEASLTSHYVGEQYLDNIHGNTVTLSIDPAVDKQLQEYANSATRAIPAYHTLGLRLSYDIPLKWSKRWNVGLQVNNLFGKAFASNGYSDVVTDSNGLPTPGTGYDWTGYLYQAPMHLMLSSTISF